MSVPCELECGVSNDFRLPDGVRLDSKIGCVFLEKMKNTPSGLHTHKDYSSSQRVPTVVKSAKTLVFYSVP